MSDSMEMRKYYGESGTIYYVTYSPKTHWDCFVETKDGFVKVVTKDAARDCGMRFDDNPRTHDYWRLLWQQGNPANPVPIRD